MLCRLKRSKPGARNSLPERGASRSRTVMAFTIIIPARYASTRLSGKPLLDINGKCLLQHVYESACNSQASAIIVATDDPRIQAAADAFGAEVCMTSADHASGTERLAEVVEQKQLADDSIIVNLQGDEFGMPVTLLDQVAGLLASSTGADIATLCEAIDSVEDFSNPNIVKVVCDQYGRALYFSRSPIPWHDPDKPIPVAMGYRHLGLYAYRAGFLRRYVNMPDSQLEAAERLEQLRALEQGADIRVAVATARPGLGIDTPADLQRARALVSEE